MAKTRQRGWWYPYIFVAGFGVVLAVNGTLAYFATSTFTGLSTDNAYEKGRLYNQNLALAKAQAAMGWSVDTKIVPASTAEAAKVDIAITYRDRDGKPVDGLTVTAAMVRPTIGGYDHELPLPALAGRPGTYGGIFTMPLAGLWDVDVAAVGDGGIAYQHAQRIVIP
ncbi:FixH family protein [Magnetospirillum sulfuroxidans]|uniref:FixH family protein n=1 Tax=Magnetospirillum sulfuroxidans TaxID=611300 RepID=A0ABS5IHI9_9PROT|nr:FixH family protein [Magnetospirillum sulfuroxidans]